MTEEISITIVMPVFNGEKYLKESISSILNQTYKDFEFIIIDDGSQDDSLSIINSFNDSRIKVIRNHRNLGIRKSRNRAIKIAQGKFIAIFDADDIARPTKLQEQFDVMTKDPSIDMCFAKRSLIDSNSKKICDEWYPSFEKILELRNWNFIGHGTVMMKTSMLQNVGGYDESKNTTGQDTELWIKLKNENKKFYFIDSIHVDYRLNPYSVRVTGKHNQDYWYRVASACVWNKQKWKSLKYLLKIKLINKLKLIIHIILPSIYIHRIIYSKKNTYFINNVFK